MTLANDNIPALYFYQRRGYRVSAVVPGAVAAHARHPETVGFAGIPILDELQPSKTLS